MLPAPPGSALGEEKPACSGLPSAWSHLLHVSPAPGKAYSLGRAEYGRLGLGEGAEEKSTPTVIPDLPSISSVACGASVGYAVSSDGEWQAPPAHGALPTPPLPLLGGCPTTSTPPGASSRAAGAGFGPGPSARSPCQAPSPREPSSSCSNIFVGTWQQGLGKSVDPGGGGLSCWSLLQAVNSAAARALCALVMHWLGWSTCSPQLWEGFARTNRRRVDGWGGETWLRSRLRDEKLL